MRFIETWTPAIVVATRDLTPGIREFLLRPDNSAAAPYPVGSHINVGVTIDGLPATRSYSLVGEADPDGYRIAVRRAGIPRRLALHVVADAGRAARNITLRPRCSRSTGPRQIIA